MSRCLLVEKKDDDSFTLEVVEHEVRECNIGEMKIKVQYSSLNFKDALACHGHPGVTRSFPHVPGIDAVGTVLASQSSKFNVGDNVIVGHSDFGTKSPGGWDQEIVVPEDWAIQLPKDMTPLDAMTLGTAGFTAAGCVRAILHNGIVPENGPVVVSGATGGVGCFSVALLSKLGFEVCASTGKLDQSGWLTELGAKTVIDRDNLNDSSSKPLLSAKWAAGIDTVGGNTLGTMLRETKVGGVVSACGVVAGHELPITVYPFILRGVMLAGIDSANSSLDQRQSLWTKLANEWAMTGPNDIADIVTLNSIKSKVREIHNGRIRGRVVVDLQNS